MLEAAAAGAAAWQIGPLDDAVAAAVPAAPDIAGIHQSWLQCGHAGDHTQLLTAGVPVTAAGAAAVHNMLQ